MSKDLKDDKEDLKVLFIAGTIRKILTVLAIVTIILTIILS
jgi:hypothetical protein